MFTLQDTDTHITGLNSPTGPVELVLITLQKSVTGCSRNLPLQYSMYLTEERIRGMQHPEAPIIQNVFDALISQIKARTLGGLRSV